MTNLGPPKPNGGYRRCVTGRANTRPRWLATRKLNRMLWSMSTEPRGSLWADALIHLTAPKKSNCAAISLPISGARS